MRLPLLPGALDAVREGMIPGGLKNNRDFIGDCVGFAESVPEEKRAILFDPQTSGGLLIAIAPETEEAALELLAAARRQRRADWPRSKENFTLAARHLRNPAHHCLWTQLPTESPVR